MADVIKATSNIGIKHIFCFMLNTAIYCFNRIMTGTSWAKSIAVAFELSFPFWFEGLLSESLAGSIDHGGNPERTPFLFSWLGYPDASKRLWFPFFRLSRMDRFCHGESFRWWDRFDSVYTCSLLSLVILRYSPDS